MLVTIGIATDGEPRLTVGPDRRLTPPLEAGLTRVHNVAIGLGFHWQRTIECDFPGEIRKNPDPDSSYRLLNTLPLETYLECVVGSEMNPAAPPEFLRAHAIISRSWAAGKILRQHPASASPTELASCGQATDSELDSSESSEDSEISESFDSYRSYSSYNSYNSYDSYDSCDSHGGSHRSLGGQSNHQVIIGWEDTSDHQGFDLCADDHCQRYQGVQPLSAEAREAIRATAGMVLTTPSGQIVDARFSKCCGGQTELFSTCWQDAAADTPTPECLDSFSDPWCDLSRLPQPEREALLRTILKDYDQGIEGGYRWQTDLSAAELRGRLQERHGVDIGEITRLEPLRRGPSGRIYLLRIHGTHGTLDLGKELYIRRLLSADCLYSSAFEVEDLPARKVDTEGVSQAYTIADGESGSSVRPFQSAWAPSHGSNHLTFRLRGKGWGHGVGLCQTGAAHMAAAGHSHIDILRFYYPGSIICRL